MATMALPFRTGRDIFMLASATAWDAREVASELPAEISVLEAVGTLVSVCSSVWTLRGDFKHLVGRQGQLVENLKNARIEEWEQDECASMACLLNDMLVDERLMLARTKVMPKLFLWFWSNPLQALEPQVESLQQMCWRIDAFAVSPKKMPGDAGMREFALALGTEQDYDMEPDEAMERFHVHS